MKDDMILIEWIDIKVDAPDYDERVLLLTNKGIIIGRRTHTSKSGHHYNVESANAMYWSDFTVTHWMDLPEKP